MSDILYSDNYAYDLSNNILSQGDIYDEDVINQSIENILLTRFGEKLFGPYFGSSLGDILFEGAQISPTTVLNKVMDEISNWEDRITFIPEDSGIDMSEIDSNAITIKLVYRINKNNIINTFKRKIRI